MKLTKAPASKQAPAKTTKKVDHQAKEKVAPKERGKKDEAPEAAPAPGWLLQCSPGLASELTREMVFRGAIERRAQIFTKLQRNHDLLFLNRVKNPEGMENLRIAETVLRCPVFGRYKVSKRQLQIMADELKALGPRRLVVSVAGRVFNRQDLSRWLHKEMSDRGFDFDPEIESEVWMFCVDDAYYFGIPVKKARDTEGRDARTEERKGSLPPTIAAAMAFSAGPKPEDVVLDPTCGSGTLLSEITAYSPVAKRIGIDVDREAIQIAKENLKNQPSPETLELKVGDSRRLDYGANDISLVMANLPFGVQFGKKPDNPALYEGILRECIRVADKEKWRAVILTSDTTSLEKAVMKIGDMELTPLFKVKIRGEVASCVRLRLKD